MPMNRDPHELMHTFGHRLGELVDTAHRQRSVRRGTVLLMPVAGPCGFHSTTTIRFEARCLIGIDDRPPFGDDQRYDPRRESWLALPMPIVLPPRDRLAHLNASFRPLMALLLPVAVEAVRAVHAAIAMIGALGTVGELAAPFDLRCGCCGDAGLSVQQACRCGPSDLLDPPTFTGRDLP